MAATSIEHIMPAQIKRLSVSTLIGANFVSQILLAGMLWTHQSDSTAIFGRFSYTFGAILSLNLLLIVASGLGLIWRQRVTMWLEKISATWRTAAVIGSGAALFVFVNRATISVLPKTYLLASWFLVALVIIRSLPDKPLRFRRGLTALTLGVFVFFLPILLITSLSNFAYDPDEDQWADTASSAVVLGRLSTSSWLHTWEVYPGVGWSVGAYGWLLEHVAFDVKVGRLWIFASYLITFAGVGAITARLYDYRTALISVVFAFLSQSFIPLFTFRPNYQMSMAAVWITFAAISARTGSRPCVRYFWDVLCGLLATLSLQLHGTGIIFAVAFAAIYGAEYLWISFRRRRLAAPYHVIFFGMGALGGTVFHYFFNVRPIGGYSVYLDHLSQIRDVNATRNVSFLTWQYLPEGVLTWAALAFIVWRRTRADRLFLAILAAVLVAVYLLDPQGYPSLYMALYTVPIGVLLVQGFATPGIRFGVNRQVLLVSGSLVLLLGTIMLDFVSWNSVSNLLQIGTIRPYPTKTLGERIASEVSENDVIATHPLVIWGMPRAKLVAFGAEGYGTQIGGLGYQQPVDVWEDVKPTVVVYIEQYSVIPPGLEMYMGQHQFIECQTFNQSSFVVHIYRQTCP